MFLLDEEFMSVEVILDYPSQTSGIQSLHTAQLPCVSYSSHIDMLLTALS